MPKQSKTMTFKIMDRSGHTTDVLDTATPEQLEAAAAKFNELVSERKFTAARPKAGAPGKHEIIKAFDPEAESLLFVPPLQGG